MFWGRERFLPPSVLAGDVSWIVTVAIRLRDLSVQVFDLQLRSFTLTHLPGDIDGSLLGVVMSTCTACAGFFVVPATLGVGLNKTGVAS